MSHSPERTIPAPSSVERDEAGRLVGLVIDSAHPFAEGAADTWLVAVDGSQHALRAVAEAQRMAAALKTCRLHLLNVQPWCSKEAAETEPARHGWEATAAARELLDTAGHPWRLHIAIGDPAERAVELANRLHCTGLVIGCRGQGVTHSLLFGSVAYKIMHMSQLPVLLVR